MKNKIVSISVYAGYSEQDNKNVTNITFEREDETTKTFYDASYSMCKHLKKPFDYFRNNTAISFFPGATFAIMFRYWIDHRNLTGKM